ncbi:hypothetical protein [Legionella brunensis]|uniref:hypothetical protein n=1 Tax=Legionella brunensis TaxID=29422 RepID=UPI0010412123|nr:hypothetical protein [Legionella brunensis]
MPKLTQAILAEIDQLNDDKRYDLISQEEYISKLNKIIIENNISDKTIVADEKSGVASWNMGCGGQWVQKNDAALGGQQPRTRGRDNPSSTMDERSEAERIALCSKVISSLHESGGMQAVLIQEGPSSTYLNSNPNVASLIPGLGIKNPGETGQVCCYTSLKNNPALPPYYSKSASDLLNYAKSLGLKDKEYQIIETAQGQIYINVHFDWGSMYKPPSAQALNNRLAFLQAASNSGIVAGDTNIDQKDYPTMQAYVQNGYAQLNGGCSTLDILAGNQVAVPLVLRQPPKVYSAAPMSTTTTIDRAGLETVLTKNGYQLTGARVQQDQRHPNMTTIEFQDKSVAQRFVNAYPGSKAGWLSGNYKFVNIPDKDVASVIQQLSQSPTATVDRAGLGNALTKSGYQLAGTRVQADQRHTNMTSIQFKDVAEAQRFVTAYPGSKAGWLSGNYKFVNIPDKDVASVIQQLNQSPTAANKSNITPKTPITPLVFKTAEDVDKHLRSLVRHEPDLKAKKEAYLQELNNLVTYGSLDTDLMKKLALHILRSPNHFLKEERHFFRSETHSNETLSVYKLVNTLFKGAIPVNGQLTIKNEDDNNESYTISRHVK